MVKSVSFFVLLAGVTLTGVQAGDTVTILRADVLYGYGTVDSGGAGGSGISAEFCDKSAGMLFGSLWIGYFTDFSLTGEIGAALVLFPLSKRAQSFEFIGVQAGVRALYVPAVSMLQAVAFGGLQCYLTAVGDSNDVTFPLHFNFRALGLFSLSSGAVGAIILADVWFVTFGIGYFLEGVYLEIGLTIPIAFQ